MMAAKIGRVRNQWKVEVETDGRARSGRRSMRGPEPGRGAAIMVRREACCLKSVRSL